MAAGAGTGVRGAGVVAERTWAEHQKRCSFPMDPIDSAGVGLDLDPNELFIFFKGEHVWKIRERKHCCWFDDIP